MAPMMDKRMADAVRAGSGIALLAYFDHPDGERRYWTGLGLLEYDGEEWTGVGQLGAVTPVKYASDLSIQEINFVLSGVQPDAQEWLTANVQDREAAVWLVAISRSLQIVGEPMQVVDAQLDFQKFAVVKSGQAAITLTGRSGPYTLERAIDEVYSPEDQRRRYPDDSGCDLITALQQQEVIWTPV